MWIFRRTAVQNVPGVIVAYYHTTAEYARNYTLTIQGSLAGYNTRDDGVIVVANGDRIIASTMKSWLIPRWRTAVFCSRSSRIFRPPRSGISSAMAAPISAVWTRSRDYYIYAYVSDRMVATDMVKNMMAALIIYLVMLTAIQMFADVPRGNIWPSGIGASGNSVSS